MAKTFSLEVVSPESIVWSGRAEMVVTRTTEGEMGILADHEPTMAALSTGTTVITAEGGEKTTVAIHGGFLQVLHNEVTLLTDRAEVAEGEVDPARLAESLADGGDE